MKSKNTAGMVWLAVAVLMLTSCAGPRVVRPPAEPQAIYETTSALTGPQQDLYHTVAPGETLWRIAKMYNVDVETLKEANKILDVTDIEIGTKIFVPNATSRRHVITYYPSNKWKYIVIHHSATEAGSAAAFNQAHIKRGWQGIGYHFIIDNGTSGKSDGQIETSPRWIGQMDGAHCKAGNMNSKGIGICLVGNFSKDKVTLEQMKSLVYLVKGLQHYYGINDRHILGHSQVPGARTECPGTRFPWREFRSRI